MDRKCIGVIVVLASCGCMSFRMDSETDVVEKRESEKVSTVTAESFDGIEMKLIRIGGGAGRFSIVCKGSYQITKEKVLKGTRVGNCVLSVGFFPGIYFAGGTSIDEPKYSNWPMLSFALLMENVVLCGVPIALSLLYEPFDTYHNGNCSVLSNFSSVGLVGCCKTAQFKPWKKQYERKRYVDQYESTLILSNYAISVDGVRYHCRGWDEGITIPLMKDAISTVKVRIDSMPKFEGELGLYVNSLVGKEFEVKVE